MNHWNTTDLPSEVPSKAEVMKVAEEAELELPLCVLLHPDPQEVPGDVEKTATSGAASL